MKDGFKHGDFRIFSPDGKIQIEGQLDSNRNVGKWQYFYPDGQIESEGFFVIMIYLKVSGFGIILMVRKGKKEIIGMENVLEFGFNTIIMEK